MNEKASATKNNKPVLTSAPPPWHTTALIAGMLAVLLRSLPSASSIDEIATEETFTHVVFPEWLTLKQVAATRLFFATVMIGISLYDLLYGCWDQGTTYYPGSKLQAVETIPFRGIFRCKPYSFTRGIMTLSSFTMTMWTVEGVTFLLMGLIPLLLREGYNLSPWVFRLAIVCWEISAPSAMLVSVVVTYVLWPTLLQNENSEALKKPLVLLAHNMNVIAALTEVSLLGGVSIRYQDFALAPLFGLAYILFSYTMMHNWADQSYGPQFIYPFFDTTLNWTTTISLLALLAVLVVSYTIFCFIDHVLAEYLGGGVMKHTMAVLVLGFAVCRFRD